MSKPKYAIDQEYSERQGNKQGRVLLVPSLEGRDEVLDRAVDAYREVEARGNGEELGYFSAEWDVELPELDFPHSYAWVKSNRGLFPLIMLANDHPLMWNQRRLRFSRQERELLSLPLEAMNLKIGTGIEYSKLKHPEITDAQLRSVLSRDYSHIDIEPVYVDNEVPEDQAFKGKIELYGKKIYNPDGTKKAPEFATSDVSVIDRLQDKFYDVHFEVNGEELPPRCVGMPIKIAQKEIKKFIEEHPEEEAKLKIISSTCRAMWF